MDQLAAAREAWTRHDWQVCFDLASAAGDGGGDSDGDGRDSDSEGRGGDEAERLELIADAAWWLGRLDDCIEARERAYLLFDGQGEHRRAGQCAVWLYENHSFGARPSIAAAWLARARRALADAEGCAEAGALLLREAEMAHGGGDLLRAAAMAEQGIEMGRQLRCTDLEAEALQTLGRVRIDQARPAEGLGLLDEAMLFALDGRLSPYSTGKVYCSLISACEQLGDHRRAAEWNDATARWAERHPFAVFPGLCRVHRATALRWRGQWAEAEREAAQACVELAGINLPNAAAAWAEIGDIRRRLGDLDGAADAFAHANQCCGQPRPGMALLHLARGDLAQARSVIADALAAAGSNRLGRASVLPALAQIAIAAGDLDGAATAVEELERVAVDFGAAGLAATAATARGRVQIARGDPAGCATLREAVSRWTELGVPYEAATASTLLGQACHQGEDAAAAAAAFDAARRLFDQLGVGAGARSEPDRAGAAGGLSVREVEVLRLVASGRTNKEIAAALFISTKTVARHLSNIFTKLGVGTRSAATAFAFEHGLIDRSTR